MISEEQFADINKQLKSQSKKIKKLEKMCETLLSCIIEIVSQDECEYSYHCPFPARTCEFCKRLAAQSGKPYERVW